MLLDPSAWRLYTDGARNDKRSGAGVVLETPEKRLISYAIRMEFHATNNDSEYEALIAGLRIAKELEITKLDIFCDSKLVVNQVTGKFQAKSPRLILYLEKVKELLNGFDHYSISHIPRSENQ